MRFNLHYILGSKEPLQSSKKIKEVCFFEVANVIVILHGYELDTDNSHSDVYGGNNQRTLVEQKSLAMTSRRIGIAMRITDLPTSENSKQK